MTSLLINIILLSTLLLSSGNEGQGTVSISVDQATPGAPVKFGIPFPQGELHSADHVRVLNQAGNEIASQITNVTSWMPADESVKWIWVFFFADESDHYTLEYGDNVRQAVKTESPIVFRNNQRVNGFAEINTGPLRFRVQKDGAGFFDRVDYNRDADGFDESHRIASGIPRRGSFLDLMDEAGIDTSSAVIHQHFIEKGSGPMHAILRINGEYQYDRDDHEPSPFVTYIHAYAGKSYVRVLHTITYTGTPDQSEPLEGRQHWDIATQTELLIDEDERGNDTGITRPKDMIASAGFGLNYHIEGDKTFRTGLVEGNWWEQGEPLFFETPVDGQSALSVFQTGPDPTRIPPVAVSDMDERIDGFSALVQSDQVLQQAQKAEGWLDLSDDKWGVSIGLRYMMEEYPNELSANLEKGQIHAYSWSPNEEPKSFERASGNPDGGMVGNFAQGITKTTELVLNFHDGNEEAEQIRQTVNFVLSPPVAHTGAEWYRDSGVYGRFASADNSLPILERSLQYKYSYMQFNQNWEPWYGMFDFGDMKNYLFGEDWVQWGNNEPAMDYQWWLNFMRTGETSHYETAQALSRHTMDVDNVHWPTGPVYRGDTNASMDYWMTLDQPQGSPYLGMGHRHSQQQATSMLSAHVWVQGWLANYYLTGYHRGLDVARLTGDYYVRRIFGGHGLTGRRLYLSVWSLSELYDATKEEVYLEELQYRVAQLLELQKKQGGRIVIDRYGYSQNYPSHGLSKYLQLFDDNEVKSALVENARSLMNTAPLDHEMESYLSSIHALVMGYDLTGEDSYLNEACRRAVYLRTDQMEQPFESYGTQRELVEQMEEISHLPTSGEGPSVQGGRRPIWTFSNGLRVFGWTHAFGVPYLIDRLENAGSDPGEMPCAVP